MPKQWRSDNIYTPVMEANWAKVLGKARAREEGDEATWSIDLLCDPNDEKIAALQKKIRGLMVEAHGNKPNVSRHGMPLKRHEVKDDNGEMQPTGMLVLKPKRIEQRRGSDIINEGPIVVDSQGSKWPASVLIGNGSLVRAKIHFWAWNRGGEGVGLSCELHAIQVVKHVSYERSGVEEAGFDVVEGGAVAPADEAPGTPSVVEPDDFGQQLTAAAQAVEQEIPF